MSKIELPSGASAEFVDADDISNELRVELSEQAERGLNSDVDTNARKYNEISTGIILRLMKSWSLADAPSAEGLNKISWRDFDALSEKATEIQAEIYPSFEPSPDPKAPTGA